MKKIYTITLDDDVPLSDNISSDISEIAFWLYSELGKFDRQILCIDQETDKNEDGLIKNDLYDIPYDGKYIYKFTSDFKDNNKYMYEPFVIDNKSFGFTIHDGSISDTEIAIILDEVLRFLKFNYKFNIDSITYDDKNVKNRLTAINKIISKKDITQINVKTKVKLLMKPIVSVLWL